jgi:hypothetical protein
VIRETPGMLVNARQDRAAFGELRIGFDEGGNGRADGGDLTFDLVEALHILPFQQRERPDFGAVFGGGAILNERFAGDMELLEFGESLAARGTRLDRKERPSASEGHFRCFAHAGKKRRIEAIGLGELAGCLGEAARLSRVDLDERRASLASARSKAR